MFKSLWKIIKPIIIGFSIFFSIILFNQLNLFAKSISNSNIYIYTLIWIIYIIIFIFTFNPVIKLLKLPKALVRPREDTPENERREFYYKYKDRILKNYKLRNNNIRKYVTDDMIVKLEDAHGIYEIKECLEEIESEMDKDVDRLINSYARSIFTSTAISQNGTLDAIFVLKLQIELIWKISHVYNQKPPLKELINIYIATLANTLAATAISEISITEITNSFISQVTTGIPNVIGNMFSKVADSVFDGTCNAILSLRVGYIAKNYCKYSVIYDERKTRENSKKTALTMIKEIGITDIIKKTMSKGVS